MVNRVYIYFGPLTGERHRKDADILMSGFSAALHSLDGDDATDVASSDRSGDEDVGVFFGPLQPATYEIEDADLRFGLHEPTQLQQADIDGDGIAELLIGERGYGGSSQGEGYGYIAAYDIHTWE